MSSRFVKLLVCLSVVAGFALSHPASAQQVTYYDFNALVPVENQPLIYSYSCGTSISASVLFCFNPNAGYPALLSDSYPASVDPNQQDNPPVASTNTTLQVTPALQSESSSAWFAVPQKVLNGFTAYVAFRLTPVAPSESDPTTATNADGIAFVIQNAAGGGSVTTADESICSATGSGLGISASGGGCLGYGGIDNSLAIEFDTYQNGFDPNNNHIAMQSCGISGGVGQPNTPDHGATACLVPSVPLAPMNTPYSGNLAINQSLGITLADGSVHQAVIEYTGATGTPANQWQVFLDPVFLPGTHTPDTKQSTPAITTTVDLTQYMNLLSSGSANDSAYVGFTGATGYYYENQEILAWTYTPHAPVVQQQPISSPGTPTTFPFGDHTYAVTYPAAGPSTSSIDMVVDANTISPGDFSLLIAGTAFAGSQCQVYDGTGGNCVIYSVYCVNDGTTTKVACPVTQDPTIAVKTAYESDNSVTPTNPGFLQGDPFFSQISSITGDGTTAAASCTGECAITVTPPATTQSVTIAGNSVAGFNGTYNVTPTGIDTFTFSSAVTGPGTGGYVTSNNLSNICDTGPVTPDNPPCWQAAKIDGTISGKTKNFSGLVALSNTVSMVGTNTAISAPPIAFGQTAQIIVSVTPSSGPGPATGSVTLTLDGTPLPAQTLAVDGTATFNVPGLGTASHPLSASYTPSGNFSASSAMGTLMVNQVAPTVSFTGAPAMAAYQSMFVVSATTNASTTAMITAGPVSVCSIAGNTVTMNSGTGTCSLTATWLADSNYSGASLPQSTTAVKLTPAITWAPASIQLGYPLGAAQLNAAANVPGMFAYTPAAGTPVNTTSQMVSALFTPTATANYSTASASVSLTVTAGPLAMVTPSSINFQNVYLGTITTKNVTVTNTGDGPMAITGPFLSVVKGGDSHEFVEVNLCPKSLAAGKSCTITIAFCAGPYYTLQTATLSIMDNAPGNPQPVTLTATVINPQATLNTNSLNFGTQKVGTSATKTVTLKNTGATALNISSITIGGANPGDFSPPTTTCPASLGAGGSCTIGITFKPSLATSWSAILTIKDNALTSPQNVSLSGKGQ